MSKKISETDTQAPWLDADEIKSRISMEDLLSHYGLLERLKRKGDRLTGLSPFREEKNPSFSVDLANGRWNDFGGRPDNVPGNIIGFVQAMERCSFREALVFLHRQFVEGTLASPDQSPKPPKEKQETPETDQAGEKPRSVENIPFSRELKGRTNIPPLLERGLTEETIKKFGVVYCTSGLMKGRIAFPIKNVKGEIMAYAGRAVKETDKRENGKYRFPPKFNKSQELFNIHNVANHVETKKAVKDYGVIVVEGFIDCMKVWQEGFKNVVALMGTDFHEAQKQMLLNPTLNPTRRITLFLDNDEAGNVGKRKMAQELINNAFLRYADYSKVTEDKNEPEHFSHDELVDVLGFSK